jgi:hypothetical protein
VGYPPLSEMSDQQRREFDEALLDADCFEDLSSKWQAAILKENRPGRSCGSSAATRRSAAAASGPQRRSSSAARAAAAAACA